MAQGQPWFGQGALNVLLILFGIVLYVWLINDRLMPICYELLHQSIINR